MKNVLVVPSGTEIALDIHDALIRRRDVRLFGAESTDNSHARWVFQKNEKVPRFDDPAFLESVSGLVDRHNIDYIFPAHDDVQLALMSHSSISPIVLSSPLATLLVTRFKEATYQALEGIVPIPQRYDAARVSADAYPVFVKPDRGNGSQNARRCSDANDLAAAINAVDGKANVTEFLPGREATVDCFSDRETGLLFTHPRERVRVRAGISVRAQAIDIAKATSYAKAIAEVLSLHGAWFFQLKERAPGDWVLLEVGARIPGGATFARMNGVNLPLLTLLEHQRRPLSVLPTPISSMMDRAFVSRFELDLDFDNLYVDFDDTLSLNGTPNFELIALLFACKHYGKRLVLLSRNEGWALDWLETRGLKALFDEFHLIDEMTPKPTRMSSRSLLIDDSFTDRKACRDAGIPCVDSDAARAILEHLQRTNA